MSTATNLMKLSLPFYSFKSSTAKFPILQRTTNSNNAASTLVKLSPWRLLAESRTSKVEIRRPPEVPSGPSYRPPSVPPEVPEISRDPDVDPSNIPQEFTTTDPPPLGRPRPDPGPDFPRPPLGPPPPAGPEVPVPPPGRAPPPEVDPPIPPDLVPPPPSTPPDYVPPPIVPPDIPIPSNPTDIAPIKGPPIAMSSTDTYSQREGIISRGSTRTRSPALFIKASSPTSSHHGLLVVSCLGFYRFPLKYNDEGLGVCPSP